MSRSTRQERQEFNATGRMHTIKTGFKSIFHHQGLADITQKAVDLVKPIIVEGLLLANLHVLRLLEANKELPKMQETFFNHCFAVVSNATGYRCQQFDPTSDPELATSYQLYCQSLPAQHQKPERPTFIKAVRHLSLMLFYQYVFATAYCNLRSLTLLQQCEWLPLEQTQLHYAANAIYCS